MDFSSTCSIQIQVIREPFVKDSRLQKCLAIEEGKNAVEWRGSKTNLYADAAFGSYLKSTPYRPIVVEKPGGDYCTLQKVFMFTL